MIDSCSGFLRGFVLAFALVAFSTAGARAADYGAAFMFFPPSSVTAGQVLTLPVGIQNTGTKVWARDDCAADTKFNVFYHWALNGVSVGPNLEGQRTPVPRAMKPGESAKLTMVIQAPDKPGDYTLTLDMVEEGVTWFSTANPASLGGPWNVKVKDAPVPGGVTGITAWYPLATPTSLQKVFVLREGNCSIDLDFGDGTKTTLAPAEAGALHPYGKGKFTLKATGCGSTATGKIEVADTACPFFLPAVKVCEYVFDCCDIHPDLCAAMINLVAGPPHIDEVLYEGAVAPGDWLVIQGEDFVSGKFGKGKVEFLLKDANGAEIAVPFQIGAIADDWTKTFILGQIPSDVSGAMAQTGFFRVTRADGVASNLYPVVFSPVIDVQTLPASAVSASCANGVSCNQCNDQADCEFSSTVPTSVYGFHQSIPVLGFLGICLLGGGNGSDHYSANLANGWTLASAEAHAIFGSGTISGPSGFALGSNTISGDVSWHVDGCKTVAYTVDLVIKGPRGVPFQ